MGLRLTFALVAVLAGSAGAQGVRVVGAEGVTLEDIAGTPTLVTVVIKSDAAKAPEDPNLRVVNIQANLFNVLTSGGDIIPYRFEDVQEVRIQGGKVERVSPAKNTARALRGEEKAIVDRAWSRSAEIFGAANDNQELKVRAALLQVLHDDEAAFEYLQRLAESNDLQTQLDTSFALYLAGKEVSPSLLRQGLESGNREARALACSLAGLIGYRDAVPVLNTMLQDRSASYAAPAARALARLGNREIIPKLLGMIAENNEEKGMAAVFALTRLGGEDVIEQMKIRLRDADGLDRYRMILVLDSLGDPLGRKLLKGVFNEIPTLAPEAALILAKEDDYDAAQFLRSRLERREDPRIHNLIYRARNAASLYAGGNRQALAVFQELLRSDNDDVKQVVFQLVSELADSKLLSILQPSIESVETGIALGACSAAISLGLPEFRERLLESRQ